MLYEIPEGKHAPKIAWWKHLQFIWNPKGSKQIEVIFYSNCGYPNYGEFVGDVPATGWTTYEEIPPIIKQLIEQKNKLIGIACGIFSRIWDNKIEWNYDTQDWCIHLYYTEERFWKRTSVELCKIQKGKKKQSLICPKGSDDYNYPMREELYLQFIRFQLKLTNYDHTTELTKPERILSLREYQNQYRPSPYGRKRKPVQHSRLVE